MQVYPCRSPINSTREIVLSATPGNDGDENWGCGLCVWGVVAGVFLCVCVDKGKEGVGWKELLCSSKVIKPQLLSINMIVSLKTVGLHTRAQIQINADQFELPKSKLCQCAGDDLRSIIGSPRIGSACIEDL